MKNDRKIIEHKLENFSFFA